MCRCTSEYKQCNAQTGECSCPAGFQGDRCDKPCEDGYYGPDCIKKCKCQGTATSSCNRVSGACHCHPGFTGEFCHALCPESTFGLKCSKECPKDGCGDGYECDAAIGCCHVDQMSCGKAKQEFEALNGAGRSTGLTWFFVLLIVALCGGLGLIALFYRNKYQKEKDPDMPTVSFHKAPNNDEGREFQNPLYSRQSVFPDSDAFSSENNGNHQGGPPNGLLTLEEEELENKKIHGRSAAGRGNNDYASLDEVAGEGSSSSASASASRRENPYADISSPDPVTQNSANKKRAQDNLYT